MNPAFKITADKKDVTALIAQRLVSINVTDETGLVSDTCEILLDNRDEKLEIPPRGAFPTKIFHIIEIVKKTKMIMRNQAIRLVITNMKN